MRRPYLLGGLVALALGSSVAMAAKITSGIGSSSGGTTSKIVDVVYDYPMIGNNSCLPVAITVPGAVASDFVEVNARFDLGEDIYIGGVRAVGSNLVGMLLCNASTSIAGDPDSGTFRFRLEH